MNDEEKLKQRSTTDVSRNEHAEKLDKGLRWCADPDTLAKHTAETATNSGNFGKPTTGERGALLTLRAQRPEAHRRSQAADHDQGAAQGLGQPMVQGEVQDQEAEAKHKLQRQIELEGLVLEYKETADPRMRRRKGGQGRQHLGAKLQARPGAPHFVDLYKAPEAEIMAEKREVERLSQRSNGGMEGHARAIQARAALEVALGLTERNCKPEEHDEQLVPTRGHMEV